jgi:8-amino-7-oxononanoate synthase
MSSIAIVGIGCRFSDAPDLQSYWDLMRSGRHGFKPIPADRWDAAAFHDSNKRATDKSYAPNGAFIDDVRSFPALALGLPPRRVEVMDPQQRMSLEVCLQAIQDSGRNPADMPRKTGVYMGVTATEYRVLLSTRVAAQWMATGQLGDVPTDLGALSKAVSKVVPSRPYSAPGVLGNMVAAAVAQELDLHGPAYTTDAACASALISVVSACQQLAAGVIDAAVAGGAYVQLTPEHYLAFSRIGAMSEAGICRPFDHRADGFVQGDGAGAVVLKRLEDAVRDGDRVYAVIEGSAFNNDGRGDGPMAPVQSGQIEVIRDAWREAGLDPALLGYVETHGTGTDVGDEIELGALKQTLGETASNVALGSSKANVGHTMSAAGIAGLIRAALALHTRVVPPMANFEHAKPEIGLDDGKFRVPTSAEPWPGENRVAAVSSFGFGGTNAHVVLRSVDVDTAAPDQAELVCLSSHDEASLRDLARRTAAWLREDPHATVAGVARAWAVRRKQPARLAVVARTVAELADRLAAFAADGHSAGVFSGTSHEAPKIAFLYPGQGSQRVGMLRDVRARFPDVDAALRELDAELRSDLPIPLMGLLYPEERPAPVALDVAEAELTDTSNQQPALLACGLALTRVLENVGVTPTVVVGHSLGEFTAAAAGGVWSAADAARFVARRGRAMADLDGDHGAMAAIMADVDTVKGFLVDGAIIANVNHPRQLVVSGFTPAVGEVVAKAQAAGVKAVPLKVSHGFHGPALASLDSEPLLDALALATPKVTVASGIIGHPYRNGADARAVFAKHATSPVDFVRAIGQCVDAGADLYVQVGAGGPLSAFARGILPKDAHRGVINLAGTEDDDGGASLLEGLGRLWAAGADLDVRPITGAAPVASVPPEVLPREVYWAIKQETQVAMEVRAGSGRAAGVAAQDAPNAPDAPAAEDADEVVEKVIGVIAKVSAYPRSAVRAPMALVEDLGFDSLMVNDMATGLADAFPGLGGIPQELLINRPTVQDLIDFVKRSRGEGPAAANDDAPLDAYTPVWTPDPGDDLPPRAVSARSVRVIGAGRLADAVRNAFSAAGHRVSPDGTDVVVDVDVNFDALPVAAVVAGEAGAPDPTGALVATLGSLTKHTPDVIVVKASDDVWTAGKAGVARSVPREWPGAVGKVVEIDPDLADMDVAKAIVAEWRRADTTVDVRLTLAGRQTLRLVASEDGVALGAGAVAITGGTRGIGARLATRLAEAGRKVVLIGRGAPDDVAAALIDTGRAALVTADVTDRAALVAGLAAHGPFAAAVHAAGVLADGPLGEVPAEQGALSRRVKVQGFCNLRAAVGASTPIVAVGSWAGRFGNRHQADYAAANALLAALADQDEHATTAEFGPWTDSDMVRTIPAAIQAVMRAEGVDFVGNEAGLDAILADVGRGGAVVHGRQLASMLRTAKHSETLDTKTHPFLLDHAIDGHPVLPLASATDLLARVAAPGPRFEITDLALYQGIVVDEPVGVTATARGDRAEIRVGSRQALAYKARVRPLDHDVTVPAAPTGGDAPSRSLAEFYAFTFHGPLLAGITAIDGVGPSFVRGRVRTGTPAAWVPGTERARFTVDPLAFDSAMQLSAYVAWVRYGRAGTPVSLGRYVQLAPLPAGEIRAEVHFGDAKDDRFSGTIVLRALDGTPLAIAFDLVAELRKVDADDVPVFDPKTVDPGSWQEVLDLEQRLDGAKLIGLRNPYFAVHEGTAKNVTTVGGRELVNFSSYNYLGLSGDPRVLADVEVAIHKYGTSVSASRVASGERPFHKALEAELAAAQGAEDSVVFTAGHATNVTTLGHLFNEKDLFLHDELIHDSAFQGMRLSGAARRSFKHDDPADLERQLKQLRGHYRRVCVAVEGVYSMDGDIAALPEYVRLKKKYGAMLFVDEAHSFGIIGDTGRGIAEHYGIDGREVDLWMGTLSKSLASCGGWIAGSSRLIRFLRYTAPGFVYSAGLTPANGQAALSSLRLMLAEPWRPKKLQSNAKVFHAALKARNMDTGPAAGESGVVPVVTGNSMHALVLSQRLVDQGINVQPIVYPAVADNAARLRFFLSSTHTEDQLRWTAGVVADTLEGVRKDYAL